MKDTILKLFARFLALFPTNLPVSGVEFKNFSDHILWAFGLPNLPSYHAAIGSMIMHLGPTIHRKPKAFFARSVKKAMANEVAYSIIQSIKNDMAREEAERKAKLEETKKQESLSDGGQSVPQPAVQDPPA